jgi:5-amino-6-(5-phosphoribosylamino)uracil reductase
MSVDGYLDDATGRRLLLSGDADFDRVDEVRASADAILVGAGTLRGDDPRLLVRSGHRRAARAARGLPPSPVKVTLTASGDLDPAARFFTAGDTGRLVYAASPAVARARARVGGAAAVIDAGDPLSLQAILTDLAERDVLTLMVEGGATVLRQFLTAGLADELQLVVAPFFVGDAAAPRFAGPGSYPYGPGNPMTLAEVRPVGGVVLLRYLLRRGGPGEGLR